MKKDDLKNDSPLAYKDSAQALRNQKDLAKIRLELRQVMSVRGW